MSNKQKEEIEEFVRYITQDIDPKNILNYRIAIVSHANHIFKQKYDWEEINKNVDNILKEITNGK